MLSATHGSLTFAKSAKATDLATLYTAGLVQNHPFVDGNQRTGFVLGVLFLELNGMNSIVPWNRLPPL